MSDQPAFCPKCGAPREAGAAFCSKCGASFTAAAAPSGTTPPPMDWRERRRQWRAQRRAERHEKSEKGEKGEKGEKPEKGRGDLTGPIIGGGVLIWLGVLVYLQFVNSSVATNFGGLFLTGIGVLLILGGIVANTTSGRPAIGYVIGGLVLIALGVGTIEGFGFLGPYVGAIFLVLVGLLVIYLAVRARSRSPPPTPPTPT